MAENNLNPPVFRERCNWQEFRALVVELFSLATDGLSEAALDSTADGHEKEEALLLRVLKETPDSEQGATISNILFAYVGIKYLESVGYPYPLAGKTDPQVPYELTANVGFNLNAMGSIIDELEGQIDGSLERMPKEQEVIQSIECLKLHAASLRALIPDTRTSTVMGFIVHGKTVQPGLRQRLARLLDHVLVADGASPSVIIPPRPQ